MFPEASRDGDARFDFLANLHGFLGGRVLAKAAELNAGSRQLQLNRAVNEFIACALRIMLLPTKAVERAASGADQPIEQAMNDLRHA
jgi:hypothetical protein